MKEKIKILIAAMALVFSAVHFSTPVFAGTCAGGLSEEACNKACSIGDDALAAAAGCTTATNDQLPTRVNNIINAVIAVVGVIAVIVIAMAGQRFLSSAGDPGKIKQARDMVLYAVVALVVAGLAFAIVTFISKNVDSNANTNDHSASSGP